MLDEKDNPFRYTNAACKIRCDRPARHHVLMLLAVHANHHDGSCYLPITSLMAETGYAKSTVCDAIAYLKDTLKLLTYTRGWGNIHGRRSNRYRLDLDTMESLKVERPAIGPSENLACPIGGDAGPATLPLTNQLPNEPANIKGRASTPLFFKGVVEDSSSFSVNLYLTGEAGSNKPVSEEGPIVGRATSGPIVGRACPAGIDSEQWKKFIGEPTQ